MLRAVLTWTVVFVALAAFVAMGCAVALLIALPASLRLIALRERLEWRAASQRRLA
jgi:hypothetical protein